MLVEVAVDVGDGGIGVSVSSGDTGGTGVSVGGNVTVLVGVTGLVATGVGVSEPEEPGFANMMTDGNVSLSRFTYWEYVP
ncbi:MAG: hypothetical protein BroJett015_11200 [Chloroflexota bacterium]|nr:MAG: hypothetical protein BroJett015_11200 [Chloroflexota bacterium]